MSSQAVSSLRESALHTGLSVPHSAALQHSTESAYSCWISGFHCTAVQVGLRLLLRAATSMMSPPY